jgi:hypothetical protein
MFTLFNKLPTELRLKIWAIASNQETRILDIWSDYIRCEQGNTTFFALKYESIIANKSPPSILQVSQEARLEALRHYSLEYNTVFPPKSGIDHSFPARFYINYTSDILTPRGHWNSVAFWDFLRRGSGKMVYLAIDVTESFWRDNVKDNLAINELLFEGVSEIILYDATRMPLFSTGTSLDEVRQSVGKGSCKLSFVVKETTEKLLKDAKTSLGDYLARRNGSLESEDSPEDLIVLEAARVPLETDTGLLRDVTPEEKEPMSKIELSSGASEKDIQMFEVKIMEFVNGGGQSC